MKNNALALAEIQTLHQSGLFDEAKKAYLFFLKKYPEHAEALHAMGILSAQQNDFKAAVDYFQLAIKHKADNPAFYLNLANSLKTLELYDQAINVLHKAIELNPNYSSALNNLGTVYFKQEKFVDAIHYFQQACALEPAYIDAIYNLGLAYTKANQLDKAQNTYLSLLDCDPENTATCFQLGCLYLQSEQISSALKYFLLVELKVPEHFETQSNLATCYLKQGVLNQAKIHYLKAYEINPKDTQILFNIGVINMQQGHTDHAIRYYQRALQEDPHQFAIHNNLGVAFLAKQHTGFALNHFRAALRLQPQNEAIAYTVKMLAQDSRLLASPPEYIKNLFDAYADHYDAHLREALDYKIPELLLNAILSISKLTSPTLDILDLGCGTGLCGAAFKPYALSLCGVDLSPNMLKFAAEKNIYDELITGTLQAGLLNKNAAYDLIIAGDVLVYLGNLKILFQDVANALRPNGLFAFNTEITESSDYTMNQSGRFSHQQHYIEQLAKQSGFKIASYQKIISRMQNNEPVYGHLYVLKSN